MAGSVGYVFCEPDTLNASLCSSADGQGAVFSAEVGDAQNGPVVGRSSEHVLGAGNVYTVDLDASLTMNTCGIAPSLV